MRKGRDLYDLLWYLSDPAWPTPNLEMLNNALRQTGWTGDTPDEQKWKVIVRNRIESTEWDRSIADVYPFLEPGVDPALLNRDNLMRLLE